MGNIARWPQEAIDAAVHEMPGVPIASRNVLASAVRGLLDAGYVVVPASQLQGAVEERDRLRALLKQAHDRDKWRGEMPPIAWYDAVADYFRGR